MTRISSGIFNKWLANYGLAWEEGDPQQAADLFAEGATYRPTPFDEPLVGKFSEGGIQLHRRPGWDPDSRVR